VSLYNPNGKPAKMLERLSEADCDFTRLAEVMPGGTVSARKRKAYHTISNMIADGLIGGGRSRYFITQAGQDLLQGLRAGAAVGVGQSAPNCRVFT
jgi:hypothetical protein